MVTFENDRLAPIQSDSASFDTNRRVDVLMTAFNAESTIVQSLSSILCQTYRDFRVIVIDDGSTDTTAEKVLQLAERDDRIRLVREPNRGIVSAANHGLTMCRGEFVARLDADDNALPTRLEDQIAYLDAHPTCVAVSGLAYHIGINGRRLGSNAGMLRADQINMWSIPSHEPYIMHPFVLMRRSAVAAVGGYRYVDYAEDTDLYWRMIETGDLFSLPTYVGEYRVHNESTSSRSILNGRISAVSSQLSAISAQRRARGIPDLNFLETDLADRRRAKTLEGIFAAVESQLTSAESKFLRFASCAKLLELNSYRPYQLDASDCVTIKAILLQHKAEVLDKHLNVRWLWAVACAKLIRCGFWANARTLYDPCIRLGLAKSLFRQLAGQIAPQPVLRRLRHWRATRAKGLR